MTRRIRINYTDCEGKEIDVLLSNDGKTTTQWLTDSASGESKLTTREETAEEFQKFIDGVKRWVNVTELSNQLKP